MHSPAAALTAPLAAGRRWIAAALSVEAERAEAARAADPAAVRADDDRARRIRLLLLSLALVSVPYLVVTFPPSTDLAQHVAQLRLFSEALQDPAGPYRIQWLTPYNLGYAVIGTFYPFFDAVTAGRLALLALALMWVGAVHYLAWTRRRSAAAAVLASLFVFNHTFYWGFFNFVFGWPLFACWLVLTSRARRGDDWRHALAVAASSFLLFFAHALWYAFALLWLGASSLVLRAPLRTTALRAAACVPSALVAVYWYVGFSKTWYAAIESGYMETPLERLTSFYVVRCAFGGLQGPLEVVFFGLVVAWVAAAFWRHRGRLGEAVDARLLLCCALLVPIVLFVPHRFQNTIYFAQRWMPVAAALLVIGAPRLEFLSAKLRAAVAAGLLAAFSLTTAAIWYGFDRGEMSGMREALAALPERPRLLGLEFVRRSQLVTGQPFMQSFAYGQALRGGELNFSFAEFPQSLVVDTRRRPWTVGLEWYPERVAYPDLQYFDHVLVNGTLDVHANVSAMIPVEPVTTEGRWRLYRIVPGAVRAAALPAAVPSPAAPVESSDD